VIIQEVITQDFKRLCLSLKKQQQMNLFKMDVIKISKSHVSNYKDIDITEMKHFFEVHYLLIVTVNLKHKSLRENFK